MTVETSERATIEVRDAAALTPPMLVTAPALALGNAGGLFYRPPW